MAQMSQQSTVSKQEVLHHRYRLYYPRGKGCAGAAVLQFACVGVRGEDCTVFFYLHFWVFGVTPGVCFFSFPKRHQTRPVFLVWLLVFRMRYLLHLSCGAAMSCRRSTPIRQLAVIAHLDPFLVSASLLSSLLASAYYPLRKVRLAVWQVYVTLEFLTRSVFTAFFVMPVCRTKEALS